MIHTYPLFIAEAEAEIVTIELQPGAEGVDATVNEGNPTLNYGGGAELWVGETGSNEKRFFISFISLNW